MKPTNRILGARWPWLALAGAGALAVVSGLAGAGGETKPAGKSDAPVLELNGRPVAREGRVLTSFAPVVKKVSPSVVKVVTKVRGQEASWDALPDFFDAPWFRRFFGDEFSRPGRRPRLQVPPRQGIGSGVIVTKDGYVLTNNHVVEEAEEVKVTLLDGRDFTAKVVGRDPKTDLAVLKVDAQDLPAIALADSDQLEVGDVVLAIGNPFGIGHTVTMGIVSATGRATLGLDYEDFIQTDAPINPGNSGGALVDVEGRLVGINTAILSRSGGNQGIGFAIPTSLARDVMEQLIKDGKVTRGYLGVMIQDLSPALAKEFKLKQTKGALISDVLPKGPAEKAGLKSGDVVLEFNGKPVTDSRQLKLQVARVKPGQTVPVKILREGAAKTLEVKVAELPDADREARTDRRAPAEDTETLKGVAVTDLDARTRRQFNIPADLRGALVAEVEPDSAAYQAGLRPGDVIVEINRQPVRSAEDAVRLTENPKTRTTLLRIWREGHSRFLVVDESHEP